MLRYVFGFFCCVHATLLATIVVVDDVPTMAKKSNIIIQGRVLSQEVKQEASGRIVTFTKVKVSDDIKGNSNEGIVTIFQVGGKLNGRVLKIEGAQNYHVGEEIILFAVPLRNMVVSYGLGLGKFKIVENQVIEDIHDVSVVNRKMKSMKFEEPQPREYGSLDEFKKMIKNSLAGKNIKLFKQKTIRKIRKQTVPHKYNFLCNSIDSNGNFSEDECGVCDDVSAPRWAASVLNMKVDMNTLPSGLSKTDWKAVVSKSMDSWNMVSGSSLQISNVGDTVTRTFGADLEQHELFWIVDENEWRDQVGSGESSTLGVTLAPYSCQNSKSTSRTLYDADLIMNGTGTFDWKSDCSDDNCMSIPSTLIHEMGHTVGLGHPCTICDWSIMSAQAGYNVQVPLFQDQQAVRSLYPKGESGLIGMSCTSTAACQSGLSCVIQDADRYCTSSCEDSSSCPNGFTCSRQAICEFDTAASFGQVGQLGQSCQNRHCGEGLTCAGGDTSHVFCYTSCSSSNLCLSGQCVSLEDEADAGVCLTFAKLGDDCDYQIPCEAKITCVIDKTTGKGLCIDKTQTSVSSNPIMSMGCACIQVSHSKGWQNLMAICIVLSAMWCLRRFVLKSSHVTGNRHWK